MKTDTNRFTNAVEVAGSRWLPPVKNSEDRVLEMTNMVIRFSGGDLSIPFEATYNVNTNGNLSKIKGADAVYPHAINSRLWNKTGVVKGSFAHPDNGSAKTSWLGAMLQDYNYGEGFFTSTNSTGKVILEDADNQQRE